MSFLLFMIELIFSDEKMNEFIYFENILALFGIPPNSFLIEKQNVELLI